MKIYWQGHQLKHFSWWVGQLQIGLTRNCGTESYQEAIVLTTKTATQPVSLPQRKNWENGRFFTIVAFFTRPAKMPQMHSHQAELLQ